MFLAGGPKTPASAGAAQTRAAVIARRGRALMAPSVANVSDYTIKNLKDVDDAAAGRGAGVEARMGRGDLDSRDLGVSYFRYDAGKRAPYGHRHHEQEEAYVVVSGSGRIKLDDEIQDV